MKEKEIEMLSKRVENFIHRLKRLILTQSIPLSAKFAKTDQILQFPEQKNLKFKSISEGEQWGTEWETAWFKLSATVPPEWQNEEVIAQIDLSAEGLIFTLRRASQFRASLMVPFLMLILTNIFATS